LGLKYFCVYSSKNYKKQQKEAKNEIEEVKKISDFFCVFRALALSKGAFILFTYLVGKRFCRSL